VTAAPAAAAELLPASFPRNPHLKKLAFVLHKVSETVIDASWALQLHSVRDPHHVKIQNRYNTNPDVYSVFGFFCTAK
jgi:hypothetical protein